MKVNKKKIITFSLVFLMLLASFVSIFSTIKAEKISKELNVNDFNKGIGELGGFEKNTLDEGLIIEYTDNTNIIKTENQLGSFSWRGPNIFYDFTTPIRDQGSCGSCYAFAAIGAFESVIKIRELGPGPATYIDLSEQYIISCGSKVISGLNGCSGGYVEASLQFIKEIGVFPEHVFPYSSQGGSCPSCSEKGNLGNNILWKASGYGSVNADVGSIKTKLLDYGPLPTKIMVYEDFYGNNYQGGIYEHKSGKKLGDHDVVIVGYNDDPGYWICKNSWGTDWGEDGWFKIKYGECGIEEDTYYIADVIREEPACLDVQGDLNLGTVGRDKTITEEILVYNRGNTGSTLEWKITNHPDFGSNWHFSKMSGSLVSYDSPYFLQISFTTPSEKNRAFDGNIRIVNRNNDKIEVEYVPVTFQTSKVKNIAFTFEKFEVISNLLLYLRNIYL